MSDKEFLFRADIKVNIKTKYLATWNLFKKHCLD
jgi:hypothetical protein